MATTPQGPFVVLGVFNKQVSQTAPDNSIGAEGDLAIDAVQNVYQKQSGAWVQLTPLSANDLG